MSPQLTEHPGQVPRGEEGGALQEFSAALSPAVGPAAAVWGGPLSV
ncbi:MAG TPA: hypothetical protein VL220_03225 [Steroidobacteraceae bacterium]|nr:hypothetical protein [Steroidobacteraceae bacterium]